MQINVADASKSIHECIQYIKLYIKTDTQCNIDNKVLFKQLLYMICFELVTLFFIDPLIKTRETCK